MLTIVSMIAATCTTVSFVPQAYGVIKDKSTDGLSMPMYIILTIGVLLWTLYGIFTKDMAIVFANSITFVLSSIILVNIIKNRK